MLKLSPFRGAGTLGLGSEKSVLGQTTWDSLSYPRAIVDSIHPIIPGVLLCGRRERWAGFVQALGPGEILPHRQMGPEFSSHKEKPC